MKKIMTIFVLIITLAVIQVEITSVLGDDNQPGRKTGAGSFKGGSKPLEKSADLVDEAEIFAQKRAVPKDSIQNGSMVPPHMRGDVQITGGSEKGRFKTIDAPHERDGQADRGPELQDGNFGAPHKREGQITERHGEHETQSATGKRGRRGWGGRNGDHRRSGQRRHEHRGDIEGRHRSGRTHPRHSKSSRGRKETAPVGGVDDGEGQ